MSDTEPEEPTTTLPTRRTAILRSAVFAGHDAAHHPENQQRLRVTERFLESEGLLSGRPEVAFAEAPVSAVEAIHDHRHGEWLHQVAMNGGGWIGADTYVGPGSYDVALAAAGAAVAGVDAVLGGDAGAAFALTRPPGHHATLGRAMGFCLLNNIAIAAARALHEGLQRVAIVDWDVHHGNGTQEVFYASDQVLFCSVHQSPFYPGTGNAAERGEGVGEGYTINVPVRTGQADAEYHVIFDELFLPALRAFEPELVLISAGYDAHADDPLGGMRLTERGFVEMTRRVMDIADRFAGGRIVAVLEGGYDPHALARSVAATIRTLDGETVEAV